MLCSSRCGNNIADVRQERAQNHFQFHTKVTTELWTENKGVICSEDLCITVVCVNIKPQAPQETEKEKRGGKDGV